MGWLVYSCPPTIGLVPSTTEDLVNDPCLLGVVYGEDYINANDLSWINNYPGQFTNNTVYFVPITIYSEVDGIYSYVNTSMPCFSTGTPIAVQYLPEIIPTVTQSCITNDVKVQVVGGLPALNGSSFTVVPGTLSPANAVLNANSITNNGQFIITGLTNGQAFTFDFEDNNGCPITISGTFNGMENAAFTYPQIAYCKNATNPTPTITGVPGGTFTGTAGLQINATTGVINLATSPSGNYTITYTTPGPSCIGTATFNLTINPLPNINAGNDTSICFGQSANLLASGGTTYTWDNGVGTVNNFTINPTATITYIVTGTDANGCVNTDSKIVTVHPQVNVNAGPDQIICLGQSVTLFGSGASTYTWDNSVVDNVAFFPQATTLYTLIGTDNFGCTDNDQVLVTVNTLNSVFAGNDITLCVGESTILTASGANTYSWNNGVSNGVTFIPPLGITTYVVTGTSAAGCEKKDSLVITVNPNPIVSFIADTLKGCVGDYITFTNLTANASNCSWNISNGTTINGCGPIQVQFNQSGIFDVSLSLEGVGGCQGATTYANYIEIIPNPVADFSANNYVLSTYNSTAQFTNQSFNAVTYLWNFGDSTSQTTVENPAHIFPNEYPGDYVVTLYAYNALGCVDSLLKTIRVKEDVIYYVPNTFTPDADNFNETFQPVFTTGFDPFDFSLLIVDRWGEIVFESHDATKGWNGRYGVDGKICQDGTYTWLIEFKTTANDERVKINGHVNIIR